MSKDKNDAWAKKYKEERKRLKSEKRLLRRRKGVRKIFLTGMICAVAGGIIASIVTITLMYGSMKFFNLNLFNLKPDKIIERQYMSQIKDYTSPGTAIYDKTAVSIVGVKLDYAQQPSMWQINQVSGNEAAGIIYSEDGYIITNYSLFQSAVLANGTLDTNAKIEVFFNPGENTGSNNVYDADLIGYSAETDIALLKINAGGLHKIDLGNSDDTSAGQNIYIMVFNNGAAQGNTGFSINNGLVCDLNKSISTKQNENIRLIQINTVLDANSPGGAVFDGQGRFIGLSSKVLTQKYKGLDYVMPVNNIVNVCESMIKSKG